MFQVLISNQLSFPTLLFLLQLILQLWKHLWAHLTIINKTLWIYDFLLILYSPQWELNRWNMLSNHILMHILFLWVEWNSVITFWLLSTPTITFLMNSIFFRVIGPKPAAPYSHDKITSHYHQREIRQLLAIVGRACCGACLVYLSY